MPTFDVTIEGKAYHVEVPDPGKVPLQVIVDGDVFEVLIAGTDAWSPPHTTASVQAPPSSVRNPRPAQASSLTTADEAEITAPMPGTILSVEVQSGQSVEAGQIVCVLEAMKMKNPIRAVRRGTVVDIAVQAGQTVSYGDLLVRLG